MVSPSRDQEGLDQLHPLCKQPGETAEGKDPFSLPEEHQLMQAYRSILKSCLICLLQKLKLLEDEYKCLLKMNREAPSNKSGAVCWNTEPKCWCVGVLMLCWCCRLLLQPQLGRLVVLGRHPSRNRCLSKLS